MIWSASLRSAMAGAAVLFLTLSTAAPAAAVDRTETAYESTSYESWFETTGAFYDANPELKTTKGSGWKPYNRAKWFYEQRLGTDGQPPAYDTRWRAWEAKQEILRTNPQLARGGSPTWFSMGPANFSGRILDIEWDPSNTDIVYVGSASGGLWKSTNAGANWAPITDELPSLAIGAVCVLPWNTNIVLIGTGEGASGDVNGVGILKSTDAGTTWATTGFVDNFFTRNGFHVMETDATTQVILAGNKNSLLRSTDEGATWTSVKTGEFFDVVWKPGDSQTIYAAKGESNTGNNVKVSTDAGATWAKAGTGQPSSFEIGKTKIAVSAAQPEWIYALYAEKGQPSGTTGIWRSTDGGATWIARNTTTNIAGGQGWYNLTLAADPNNASRLVAGGVNLFKSTNGATSWTGTGTNVHVDHHAAGWKTGSDNEVWVGSDGGVWRSANDGDTWTNLSAGLVTYQFYDICVNNGPTSYYVMGGTQDNGTDKWSGSTTWSNGLGADGMVCMINPVNGNTVFAEIQNGGLRKNTNSGGGGPNWPSITNGFTGGKAWVTPWAEDQLVGNHLYAGSSDGIFESTNGGGNWTNVAPHAVTWIDFSDLSSDIAWTLGGFAHVTTDHGDTWTLCEPFGFPTGGGTKILGHPTIANGAVVVFNGPQINAKVALTTDLGMTWSDRTGDFVHQQVNAVAVDPLYPDEWYLGTDLGIWKTSDAGTTWLPWDNGFPNVVVADLEIRLADRKLVAGTYGRGAWEMDLPPAGGTGVAVGINPGPANLMLDRPMPNPVRDRTLLRWAAKAGGSVSLDIYDVTGRHVINLAEISHADGIIRETPWFPADVPAGVYFAVIRAGGEQLSRKMVITR